MLLLRRLTASIADTLILLLVFVLLLVAPIAIIGEWPDRRIPTALLLSVPVLYFGILESGRVLSGSIGKRALGLSVYCNSGQPLSTRRSLLRTAVKLFLPAFVYQVAIRFISAPSATLIALLSAHLVIPVTIISSRGHRSVHDVISGTRVARRRSSLDVTANWRRAVAFGVLITLCVTSVTVLSIGSAMFGQAGINETAWQSYKPFELDKYRDELSPAIKAEWHRTRYHSPPSWFPEEQPLTSVDIDASSWRRLSSARDIGEIDVSLHNYGMESVFVRLACAQVIGAAIAEALKKEGVYRAAINFQIEHDLGPLVLTRGKKQLIVLEIGKRGQVIFTLIEPLTSAEFIRVDATGKDIFQTTLHPD